MFKGILGKNWNRKNPAALLTLVLAVVLGMMIIIKIIIAFYYGSKDGFV